MITDEQIARINELYHKMKDTGLSPQEKEEQAHLRGLYIASIRASLRGQLDNIDIENADGSIEHVRDRAKRNRKG